MKLSFFLGGMIVSPTWFLKVCKDRQVRQKFAGFVFLKDRSSLSPAEFVSIIFLFNLLFRWVLLRTWFLVATSWVLIFWKVVIFLRKVGLKYFPTIFLAIRNQSFMFKLMKDTVVIFNTVVRIIEMYILMKNFYFSIDITPVWFLNLDLSV